MPGACTRRSEALEEAITSFRARGDLPAAARAMGTLGEVLYRLGDPRWADLPAEAVALLEPLPPGPELVSALTELARAETLQGRSRGRHPPCRTGARARRASSGLPRPARTLGYRGLARCELGDAAGLDDFREAIVLATEAGQGREAGVIYGNMGETLWAFEGAVAALEVMRAGIAFAQDRGLAEMVDYITAACSIRCSATVRSTRRSRSPPRSPTACETADITALVNARAAQARVLSLRGQAPQVAGSLDWLESTAGGANAPDYAVIGLVSAALARAALGEDELQSRCSHNSSPRREPAWVSVLRHLPSHDGSHRSRGR